MVTLLWLYVSRNFGKLIGLECPEPLANLYAPGYFRATWITTALDAGFWSAMPIKRRWIRDSCSILFTIYYLVCAEQADEKVRKVRSILTVDHLRVSWNKTTTPYLAFFTKLLRPRFLRNAPRAIRIPRPSGSVYKEPVHAWLYFDGPLSALKKQSKVIFFVPGGGFVAMGPRTHDDALCAWAGRTGLPVLAIDYRKAPEFPYPYALNECFDAYTVIFSSQGRCIGLSGERYPKIIVGGDSAGGNLATGLVLMALESGATDTRRWHGEEPVPPPEALVLIYPALDMNIGNWMTDEQMALIRDRDMRTTNSRLLRRKNSEFGMLTPNTPLLSESEENYHSQPKPPVLGNPGRSNLGTSSPADLQNLLKKTRLATPSLISYMSDRMLTPEMLRAMILLYLGPHSRPNFATEYHLSPVLAPDQLLANFPKTFFMTGERDPLCDDTAIFAGRIRNAKRTKWTEQDEIGLLTRDERKRGWKEHEHLEIFFIEGISHGFIQMAQIWPKAWDYVFQIGDWFESTFARSSLTDRRLDLKRREMLRTQEVSKCATSGQNNPSISHPAEASHRNHHRSGTSSSGEEDHPLEMSTSLRLSRPVGGPATVKTDVNDSRGIDSPRSPYVAANGLARDHPLRARDSMVISESGDDLLGRRMRGLVEGLTRVERENEAP